MNNSYYEEVSENLITFETECIFVGYNIKERRNKQTIALLAVTWFTKVKSAQTNTSIRQPLL